MGRSSPHPRRSIDKSGRRIFGKPGSGPGMDKALAYLQSLHGCRDGRSVQRMADEADVSYPTMWRAVKCCPVLRMRPFPGAQARVAHVAAWERVKGRIREDLMQGRLSRHGALPQTKELCIRYDAGFRTVSRALEALRSAGALVRRGRSYRSSGPARPSQPTFSIAVLIHSWSKGRPPSPMTEYEHDLVRDLEIESFRRNISIDVVPFYQESARTVVLPSRNGDARRLEQRKGIDGYVVPFLHVRCFQGDLLEQLQASAKPVALVDQMGGWEMPSSLARRGSALHIHGRSFGPAAREAGRQIAAHGHRNVAFFSAYHHDLWSHQCLEGLTEALASAGCPPPMAYVENGSQTDTAYDYMAAADYRKVSAKVRRTYRDCRGAMPEGYAAQLDSFFTSLYNEHLCYAEARHVMQRHFKACAADNPSTCWVAADQDMAWFANDYIVEHCPKKSVVGFGSSGEITRDRITTVDFNSPAAAHAAVEFLLYPNRRLPGQDGVELEIRGMLVDRGSLRTRIITGMVSKA